MSSNLSRRRFFTISTAASAGLLIQQRDPVVHADSDVPVPSHWISVPPILCRECKMQFMLISREDGFEVEEVHADLCSHA